MPKYTQAVCPSFDAAVLFMARSMFPQGFDVGEDAPDTFARLKREFADRGRITVWNGGSDATIFAHPSVNYAMRAWHDACHIRGDFDFTLGGETQAAEMQIEQLAKAFPYAEAAPHVAVWSALIRAEVIGQAEAFEQSGAFIDDQRPFVLDYMARHFPGRLASLDHINAGPHRHVFASAGALWDECAMCGECRA